MSGRVIAGLAVSLAMLTGAGFALSAHDRGPAPHHHAHRAGAGVAPVLGAAGVRRLDARPPSGRRVAAVSRRTGIPAPAVRAYARGQREAPRSCHVGWPTLAGVGWVESQHGTLGGRTLRADGRSSSAVVGPALDGRGSFAAIRSTPGSARLHGDARWEHALGPMQFLPETWARWGRDGDGDGRADVLDLDDAAAGTARYLCASGGDLGTVGGWQRAVLAYNHSGDYLRSVFVAASTYARAARR